MELVSKGAKPAATKHGDIMNRRSFLTSGFAAAATLQRLDAAGDRVNHHLPARDTHHRDARSYVDDPAYRWAANAAYERFRDIKYGVRLHWGLYSILGQPNDSWPFLPMSFADRQRNQSMYKTWNPRGFNADEWMHPFAACGMKMFAFTTEHLDGFSMFDARTRVRRRTNRTALGGPKIEDCKLAYSIMETPFRRDVVKELCRPAHKRDIKINLYFSNPDWYDADFRPYVAHPLQAPSADVLTTDYQGKKKRLGDKTAIVPDPGPAEVNRMMARHRAQLTELLTSHGNIDMLDFDMYLGPKAWPQLRATVLYLRKLRPEVMCRARGIGDYGDYYTPEGFVPGDKSNTDTPRFVIYPLGRSFSYVAVATSYKGASWVVRNLVDSVAKGDNFMVAAGPNGDGRFHPTAVSQLREVGEWLKVNGKGIYSSREREADLGSEGADIRFTRTKDKRTICAFVLQRPGEKLLLRSMRPAEGSVIQMLGTDVPLQWGLSSAGLEVQIPPGMRDESRRPCRFAWGFQIRTETV
jgi:alpha-L-fucosidase